MSTKLLLVLALLAGAIVLFAIGRPRFDVVALLMMAMLPFTGVVSVGEAIAGFADPVIVLIALLFVIGEGLVRTGVAQRLSQVILRIGGGNETGLIVALMSVVAGIGSVMSSTGIVAIFIPIVLRIARVSGIAPARLMMPLSVAALISGMMTLVATSPNLVVHAELLREGNAGLAFFSFTPFGIPMLVAAIAYMLFARRWLAGEAHVVDASRPRIEDWIEAYALAGREYRVRVADDSPLIGDVASELEETRLAGASVLALEQTARFGRQSLASPVGAHISAGDILLLDVHDGGIDTEARFHALRLEPLPLSGTYFSAFANDIGMAEMMVPANSRLIGRTAKQARLRERHELGVIGLRHGRTAEIRNVENARLEVGDTLLVAGPWAVIRALGSDPRDLIVLDLPAELEDVVPSASRAPFAVAILLLVVTLMVSNAMANVHAALIGCLLMGLCGCIDLRSAYRAIHWPNLILIVGMLPFSLALQRTGGVDLAADWLLDYFGEAGPRPILAILFLITTGLGMFVSNTAVAVLMAPVALAVADHLGASPQAFAMTVALAASTAFVTPMASPVNALVAGPGGYRFVDFVRIGTPLALISLVIAIALVPVVLPL